MLGLNLSINFDNVNPSSAPAQFTADWGNLIGVTDISPAIFYASDSGATQITAFAKTITYSGKNISVTLSISGTGNITTPVWIKNGGAPTIYTGAFTLIGGDTLILGVRGPNASPALGSGNLIVTNSTDSYIIDTIPYDVNVE